MDNLTSLEHRDSGTFRNRVTRGDRQRRNKAWQAQFLSSWIIENKSAIGAGQRPARGGGSLGGKGPRGRQR